MSMMEQGGDIVVVSEARTWNHGHSSVVTQAICMGFIVLQVEKNQYNGCVNLTLMLVSLNCRLQYGHCSSGFDSKNDHVASPMLACICMRELLFLDQHMLLRKVRLCGLYVETFFNPLQQKDAGGQNRAANTALCSLFRVTEPRRQCNWRQLSLTLHLTEQVTLPSSLMTLNPAQG